MHCGAWSEWNRKPDDRCTFCGELLDPDALRLSEARQKWEQKQEKQLSFSLIEIHPHDSAFTRFWKRIVQAFQITFFSILSFILWLIAWLAG